MVQLNIVDDPREIFTQVLNALESHRKSKAELGVLDALAEHYGLPDDRELWVEHLLTSRVEVDAFLKFTLACIEPFVLMVLELYSFLHEHVSTTGGRTQQFRIVSDDLANPWTFDVSKLPKQIEWISAWMDMEIEEVEIDWERLNLVNDNGIFYASTHDVRLAQSLVVARRDGSLSAEARQFGDRLRDILRRAARAWLRTNAAERGAESRIAVFLPSIARQIQSADGVREVAVNADVALGTTTGFRMAEVFQRLDDRTIRAGQYAVGTTVYFSALWGLDEASFRAIARELTAHEGRNVLSGGELTSFVHLNGDAILRQFESAIRPTGKVWHERELQRQRLEILLLPFWKDRWFLYEVWSLVQVVRRGLTVGARLELIGVDPGPIAVWDLPTQKAKEPVARFTSNADAVLVWFQRETKRRDRDGNMEPDLRLTAADGEDLAIVECKDRVKFAGARSNAVVDSYLTGSAAKLVWLINYEGKAGAVARPSTPEGQASAVANGFRPGAIPASFGSSLERLLREQLKLEDPIEHPYVVIDVSGSMKGKRIRSSVMAMERIRVSREPVRLWNDAIVNAASFDPDAAIEGGGVENPAALEAFAVSLPLDAKLTVITDASGRQRLLEQCAPSVSGPPPYTYRLRDRALNIVVVDDSP